MNPAVAAAPLPPLPPPPPQDPRPGGTASSGGGGGGGGSGGGGSGGGGGGGGGVLSWARGGGGTDGTDTGLAVAAAAPAPSPSAPAPQPGLSTSPLPEPHAGSQPGPPPAPQQRVVPRIPSTFTTCDMVCGSGSCCRGAPGGVGITGGAYTAPLLAQVAPASVPAASASVVQPAGSSSSGVQYRRYPEPDPLFDAELARQMAEFELPYTKGPMPMPPTQGEGRNDRQAGGSANPRMGGPGAGGGARQTTAAAAVVRFPRADL